MDATGALEATIGKAVADMVKTEVDSEAVQNLIRETVVNHGADMVRAFMPTVVEMQKTVSGAPLTTAVTHRKFATVMTALQCGNVALIGPAGSGKTTLASQIAEALDLPFHFNGAIASEYKLSGFIDANGNYVRTPFREAFEHGGVYLFDEIDASMPQALLPFNAALANGHADFPDGNVKCHENFLCMAAANTYGRGADRVYVGRNQLDATTLDRFIVVDLDYDFKLERALANDAAWVTKVQLWRIAAEKLSVRHIISPRASIFGAKLLASGIDQEEVEKLVVWKGLDADTVKKVKRWVHDQLSLELPKEEDFEEQREYEDALRAHKHKIDDALAALIEEYSAEYA